MIVLFLVRVLRFRGIAVTYGTKIQSATITMVKTIRMAIAAGSILLNTGRKDKTMIAARGIPAKIPIYSDAAFTRPIYRSPL